MRSLGERIRRHSNLVLLLVSGLLLPVITNLASSWLEMTIGRTPNRLMQLLAVGIALAVGLWVLHLALGRRGPVELVPEEKRPPCFPGLIVLVGVGRKDVEPAKLSHNPAIEYHLDCEEAGGEPVRVCWLVATGGVEGSVPVAREVRKRYESRCDKMILRELNSAFDVQEAYRLIRRIYTEEATEHGLAPEQIIADFTGGTKPMSAGMILACQDRWPMQYMFGREGEIASTPLLVRFQSAEAESEVA
jgi:hypothetical protein